MYTDIELNENAEDKKAGRTQITMTALTIHERGQWNRRGITWLEKYVQSNIKSIIGAPFVVCFVDDEKTIPSGHGTDTYDEKGNLRFDDGDTVGSIQNAWIDEVVIDGEAAKRLVVSGYLYNQRYPNFVNWLKSEIKADVNVKGSVEINGKGECRQIIYEDGGTGKDQAGNWVIGRVPVIYDFTGLCILLPDVVQEADPGSEVLEINAMQESTEVNSDDIKNISNKEEELMAETKDPVIELNEKIVELNTSINELNAKIEEKDSEINSLKEKETELNSLLVEANKNVEAQKTQIGELNSEIEPLRKMKKDSDTAKAQSEVNSYFETIKSENGFSEAELNSLKTDFVDKCDLSGLKNKEAELCVNKFKEMKKTENVVAELNSTNKDDESTLFFSTKAESVETNSADDGSDLFK